MFRGTDNLTSEVTYKVDSNGSETISDSNVSTEKRTKVIYEDLPSLAHYGFLTINSASTNAISLSATIFSVDGTSFKTISKTINKGKTCDLDGDGYDDLKYDEPPIKRTGYENARWLTFICSGYTSCAEC